MDKEEKEYFCTYSFKLIYYEETLFFFYLHTLLSFRIINRDC
jgi:hypothetical protein